MNYTVHPNEKKYYSIMVVISCIAYAFLFIALLRGGLPIATPLMWLVILSVINILGSLLLIGTIKTNAIKVTERQFPEIHALLIAHSEKLGINPPATYILQSNGALNAFATKFGSRNFVILYSDVLEVAYQEGMDAVSFIIGHELGHIKRKHVSFLKSLFLLPARIIPFLSHAYSRGCESTCDNIGYALCPQGSVKGLLVLGAGKQLYKKVNTKELQQSMNDDAGFVAWFAEILSTHPALLRRVSRFSEMEDSQQTDSPFVSPSVEANKSERQL